MQTVKSTPPPASTNPFDTPSTPTTASPKLAPQQTTRPASKPMVPPTTNTIQPKPTPMAQKPPPSSIPAAAPAKPPSKPLPSESSNPFDSTPPPSSPLNRSTSLFTGLETKPAAAKTQNDPFASLGALTKTFPVATPVHSPPKTMPTPAPTPTPPSYPTNANYLSVTPPTNFPPSSNFSLSGLDLNLISAPTPISSTTSKGSFDLDSPLNFGGDPFSPSATTKSNTSQQLDTNFFL